MASWYSTSKVVKCNSLVNTKKFETIKLNNINACIYVCRYDSDDDGFITGPNANFYHISWVICTKNKFVWNHSFIRFMNIVTRSTSRLNFIHQSTMLAIQNSWNSNRKSIKYGLMFSTKDNSESYILLFIRASCSCLILLCYTELNKIFCFFHYHFYIYIYKFKL